MPPTKQRIAVDMDEVLADAVGELLNRYNREKGKALTKADIEGKWLWQAVPERDRHRLTEYLNSEDFFEDLLVIPDSQQVLYRISQRYEIFIATAAMAFPNSFGPKYRWLRRHFPFLPSHNYVFCGDKNILRADYLIDDMPHNLAAFQGEGILFTAAHNIRVTDYRRADNWQDVARIFLVEE